MKKPWRKKLKTLVRYRTDVDGQIKVLQMRRDELNSQIQRTLDENKQVEGLEISGYSVVLVRPKKYILNFDGILNWYRKHDIRSPEKKVFDTDRFEKDIKEKTVPASVLRKHSTVEEQNPYVRIQKL